MKSFGDRLRGAMKARGMSETDLGREVGLWQTTINSLKRQRSPRPSDTIVLARVLNVRPEWLAFGEGPMEPERGGEPTVLRQLFADTLKTTRQRRGFKDAEALAKAAGLDPIRLRHFEAARLEPMLDELLALREALRVRLDFLIAYSGPVEIEEGEEARPEVLHERPPPRVAGPRRRRDTEERKE